jgi:surface protein
MFSVDKCLLPTTGGTSGLVIAAVFLLVLGIVVARWVRASAGSLSVVAAVPILLMALVGVSAPGIECAVDSLTPTTTLAPTTSIAPTTTVATTTSTVPLTTTTVAPETTPPTTVVPANPSLILDIDTRLTVNQPGSFSALQVGSIYEIGLLGDVDVHIEWGDGLSDDVNASGPFSHIYTTSGEYTIEISGSLTGFGQIPANIPEPLVGASYLVKVRSFGDLGIESLAYTFYGSVNLREVPVLLPATVTALTETFVGATSFNGNLSSWVTSNVTNMTGVFSNATSFNGDIGSWDTSNVTHMIGMFYGASSFNSDVSDWDTSKVVDMSYMFFVATAFDQSLGSWDIGLVALATRMLDDAHLSTANYDATLIGWASRPRQVGLSISAGGMKFSSLGAVARNVLTDCAGSNWIIVDGGLDSSYNNSRFEGDQSVVAGCNDA